MPLTGKNRAIFSYSKKDRSGSKFVNKDFEKTKSYMSRFINADFSGTSLRAAHMKFCNFDGASFVGTEFVGTNLRGSTFRNARFIDAIFISTTLDSTDFSGATFTKCCSIATNFSCARKPPSQMDGITILLAMPPSIDFSDELISAVEALRSNDIIRRSHTLHLKNGKPNTLSLKLLKIDHTESDLITLFSIVSKAVTTQFYTLSYLRSLLKKLSMRDIT